MWDIEAKAEVWQTKSYSRAFAKALVLPEGGGHSLDAAPENCMILSPLEEPHVIGVFQSTRAGKSCEFALATAGGRSLGMCMGLYAVPALGSSYVLTVYESTDACIWDLRSPRSPAAPSINVFDDMGTPAICAAVLWKQVRSDGRLQRTSSVRKRLGTTIGSDVGGSCAESKLGVNQMAVRPDLRLLAAAGWDHRIELFDVKTQKELGTLRCHTASVLSVAFDRERGALATCGEDGRIAIWATYVNTYAGPYTPDAGKD